MVAPVVSEYLGRIGAVDHQKLFEGFLSKHGIYPRDLSSFDVEEAEEFEKQTQRYPFEEYDDVFYELEPPTTYLKPFISEHVSDF